MTDRDAKQLADSYGLTANCLVDGTGTAGGYSTMGTGQDWAPCTGGGGGSSGSSPSPPPASSGGSGDCTDSSSWTDSYGDGCTWYAANDLGCTHYSDYGQKENCKQTCNQCGGGGTSHSHSPHSHSPHSHSPHSHSPHSHSPHSHSPAAGGSNSGKYSDATCYAYKNKSYCQYSWFESACAYTCAGGPTDRYSNCASLASEGKCGFNFNDGLSVREGCPQSCAGSATKTKANKANTLQADRLEGNAKVPDGIKYNGPAPTENDTSS
jgi:hypothetical protein